MITRAPRRYADVISDITGQLVHLFRLPFRGPHRAGLQNQEAGDIDGYVYIPPLNAENAGPEIVERDTEQEPQPLETSSILLRRLAKRREKLLGLRDEVLQLRIHLDYAREELAGSTRHYEDSQNAFNTAVTSFVRSVRSAVSYSGNVESLLRELEDRGKVFAKHMEEVRQLETKLSEKEIQMAKREAAWVDLLSDVTSALDRQLGVEGRLESRHLEGPIPSIHSLSSSTDKTEMPELLAAYYDKVGDMDLFAERLGNLVAEYEEAKVSRQLKADREEPLDDTESEFERHYADEAAELKRKLAVATEAAKSLRQQCIEAGVQIEGNSGNVSETTDIVPFNRGIDSGPFSLSADASPTLHGTEPNDLSLGPLDNFSIVHLPQNIEFLISNNSRDSESPPPELRPEDRMRIRSWQQLVIPDSRHRSSSTSDLRLKFTGEDEESTTAPGRMERSLSPRRTKSLGSGSGLRRLPDREAPE